jgi:hypothetical protein
MDQSFYQENVNFSLLKQKNVKRDKNPTDYMTKRIFAAGTISAGL